MKTHVLVIGAGLVTAIAVLLAFVSSDVKLRRLPDGTPDVRGTWMRIGGGLEDVDPPATDLKFFGEQSEPQGFGEGPVAAGRGGAIASDAVHHHAPTLPPRQGIIYPTNRRLPYTAAGRAKRLDYAKNMCCPAKSLNYLELSLRCAPPQPWVGGVVRIMQQPGQVALFFEDNHQTRILHTDHRSHPDPAMRFFGGHSIARWENNILIVDVTNLDGRAYFAAGKTFAPFSQKLRITERYVVQSNTLITFLVTYDDPETFTQPVTSAGYLYLLNDDEELTPELTCHESNYSMQNVFGF